jgi:hypothetical protein
VSYGGKTIPAEDTIDVRITDKIRRLVGGGTNYMNEPDEQDLLGYLVIKLALRRVRDKEKNAAKEERKRQLVARAKEVTNSDEVKSTRRRRVADGTSHPLPPPAPEAPREEEPSL